MATIEINQNNDLDRLLLKEGMEKKIESIIRSVLKQTAKGMQNVARASIPNDPRNAYKAVRTSVYRRILGGNINILNRGKAKPGRFYAPPRKLREGQRGGNRMSRSERTTQMMSYQGADRGMILFWLNSGTNPRTDNKRGGNRGQISARGWFANASNQKMKQASEILSKLIDQEIQKQINTK